LKAGTAILLLLHMKSKVHSDQKPNSLEKNPVVPCMLKRFPWRGMQLWSDITLLLLQLKRDSQKPYLIMRGR